MIQTSFPEFVSFLYFQWSRIAVLREGEAPAEPWISPIRRLGRSLALPQSVAVLSISICCPGCWRNDKLAIPVNPPALAEVATFEDSRPM